MKSCALSTLKSHADQMTFTTATQMETCELKGGSANEVSRPCSITTCYRVLAAFCMTWDENWLVAAPHSDTSREELEEFIHRALKSTWAVLRFERMISRLQVPGGGAAHSGHVARYGRCRRDQSTFDMWTAFTTGIPTGMQIRKLWEPSHTFD